MKKLLKSLKREFKNSTSSTYLKLALIAITLVPLLYGALYLKAFWDPYAKIDEIPVAVVNLDKGYKKDNETINIGNELVSKLKNNDNLKWNFVNEKEANDGLNAKKYYASITVPSDFTQNIYSVDSKNPQKANIAYKSRESTNYLAKTITNRVASEVANSLSSEVISKYFNNIFVSIKDTSSELQKAADGANQLQNGLANANNGTNLLKIGLSDSLNGNSSIVTALGDLNIGQKKLTDGLAKASSATSTLKTGSDELASAQDQLKSGLDSLSSGATSIKSAVGQSKAGADQAAAIINNYITAHPESASELTVAYQTLLATSGGLSQTGSGADQLATKLNEASQGVQKITNGQTKISSGLNTLGQNLDTAKDSSQKITDGSSQILTGSSKLDNGLSQLYNGASSLQLGLATAETGSIELKDKLTAGADQAEKSSSDSASEVNIMSAPITTSDKSYDNVANYGSGLAPYFISLALWVGGLMTFFVLDFEKKPKNKLTVITKYLTLCVVGITQTVILDLVLILGLGLKVQNIWQFYLFTILISLTFMSVLQLLIHNLGNIGRYIAIILLVLQLTSSTGTFPKETLPMFFQIINPILPMTYCVSGIRDILFTNELSNLMAPVLFLLSLAVACLLTNLFLASHKTGKLFKKVV